MMSFKKKGQVEIPAELADKYEIGDTLGSGSFSVVKLVKERETEQNWALKIIDKSLIGDNSKMATNEIDILKRIFHPNVISLREIFETKTHLFLVMELVKGGELFDEIVNRGAFSEKDAAELMRQVVSAVDYLHSQGIVHRDLKPENLLFDATDCKIVKIADFGLSRLVGEQTILKTACGTPGYVAPEVLKCQGYGQEVDMWACGVILYILYVTLMKNTDRTSLCGFPPFYDENLTVLYEQILTADYMFPEEYWSDISESAKDLIRRLLVLDPAERMTAKQMLKHPWLAGYEALSKQISVFEEMKKYNSQRKLKVAVAALIARNRLSKQQKEDENSNE